MKYFVFLLCVGVAVAASARRNTEEIVDANEICFDHYGCFSTESPWTSLLRPQSRLPDAPHVVGTRFLLYTRENQNENFELMPDNEFILKFSPYDAARKTVYIVHGLKDSDKALWVQGAKDALLEKEDLNVIVVDWAPGAKGTYHRAVANARLVGSQMERMSKFLAAKASLNYAELEIIGHSIGAHVAGYLGHRLGGAVGHITALDASDPYFGGTDPLVRLDQTDAQHVHAIHTNGHSFGLGISKSFAHVDIYPNGGNSQPGCRDLLNGLVSSIIEFIFLDFEGALGVWACSHVRVVDFYVESIKSQCPFVAYKCGSTGDFNDGKCTTPCTAEGSCTVLGYGSERNTALRGDFYLNTAATDNFCLQAVRFDTPVGQSQQKTNGKVTVQFRNSKGEASSKFTIADGSISSGQLLNKWVEVPSGVLSSATERPTIILNYKRGGLLPTTQPKYLTLDSLVLYVLDENLQLQEIRAPSGVTLEAGVDLIVQT